MSSTHAHTGALGRLARVGVAAAFLVMSIGVMPVLAAQSVIDPIAPVTVAEGDTAHVTVTVTDADPGDVITIDAVPLEPFMSFVDNGDRTGELTIAPGFSDAGSYSVTLASFDGDKGASYQLSITVTDVNGPAVIDPIGDQTVAEGATKDVTISAADPDGDTITLLATGLPAWATFTDKGAGKGVLHLAPGYTDAGNYPVAVTAASYNEVGATVQEAFTINVTDVNPAPVLAPVGDQTVAEGAVKDVTVTATDANGDPILLVAGPLPSWATFTDHGDGTGTLHLAPGYTDAGSYPLTVGATDAINQPVSEKITITVTNTDRAPVLDPIGTQTVAEGATKDVPITATDPDGDLITLVPASLPAWATLTDNGGGHGVLHLAPGYTDAGSVSATIAASTFGAFDSETFTINVTNTNRAPVFTVSNRTITEGGVLNPILTASDPDGDAVSFLPTSLPAWASLTDNGDGTATLHIAPAAGDAGTYPSQISATDGSLTTVASFNITVTVGDSTPPDITVPGDMTVEATGATGAVVTFSASATDDVTSGLTPTCTPASGSTFALGTTTVTCSATDTANNTGTATFDVTVVDTTAPSVTGPAGGALPDIQVAATRPVGTNVSFGAAATDVVDGTVATTCSPASGSLFPVGVTTVTCTATDVAGNTGSATFAVIVSPYTGPIPTTPPTSTVGASPEGSGPALPAFLGLVAGMGGLLMALGHFGRSSRRRSQATRHR